MSDSDSDWLFSGDGGEAGGGKPGEKNCNECQPDPLMQLLVDDDCTPSRRSRSRSRTPSRRSRSLGRSNWPTTQLVKAILSAKAEPEPNPEEDAFSETMEEVRKLNLPIFDSRLKDGSKASIENLASIYRVESFYVGATLEPVRRWLGDEKGDRPLPGHGKWWHEMHLIDVATNQCGNLAGRILEEELIEFAMEGWPSKCKNVAEDARGQCMGINFMYVVMLASF